MVLISPEQNIYNKLWDICAGLFGAGNVYEYLPGEVGYPFVYLGEQLKQNDRNNKDKLDRQTQVTIHVWHNDWRKRVEVSNMLFEIEKAVIREFGVKGEDISTQMLPDNSTSEPLMHGILETNISY